MADPTTPAPAPAASAVAPAAAATPPAATTPAAAATATPAPAPAATPTSTLAPAAAALEFKLPEGFDPKDPLLEGFRPIAAKLGLDGPKAQELVDLYVKAQEPLRQAQAQLAAERKAWVDAVRSDPELGTGAAFDVSIKAAQNAVTKFGGPDLAKALNESGLGDHPAVVRAFARIGKALGEDSIAGTNVAKPKTPANDPETLARSMYPTMFTGS